MSKKINDIRAVKSENSSINLGENLEIKKLKDKKRLKGRSEKVVFKKQNTPINEIRDLEGSEKKNYLYLKGKTFKVPKFLGNLIKIAVLGFIIVFITNGINIYYSGKALEKEIASSALDGYSFLIDAGKSATQIEFTKAQETFDKAIENFSSAEKSLWFIETDKTFYSENQDISLAINAILEGGKEFAVAGGYFVEALEEFNKIPLYFVNKNSETGLKKASITDVLIAGLDKTNLAIEQISLAAARIEKVNEKILPPEIRGKVIFAKEKIKEVEEVLNATAKNFPAMLKLLGDRYPHRYLILFQNNNEMRPTGGFIGSYAIMDINDGYIEKLETHDVYDIDGAYGGVIEPPEEFKTFTSNWRFRDSNYSPDFPISAKKARWFLEKEGGPSVDTVVVINQGLLRDLLNISGPVQVGNFGKLNSENYNLLLSFVIEGKIWGAEDPKHILKIFVPAFKDAILKEENVAKLSSKLYRAIQQKHIMMYSVDEDVQSLFESIGVDGTVYRNKSDEDYLSVINISTGGTKSDQFIEESILHETHIGENGELTDEITIKRSHLWDDSIYIEWKKILSEYGFDSMPDQLIDTLGRGRNRVWVRIYVPEGSKVLETNISDLMIKYDNDLRKTYFLAEIDINAGESDKIWIKYALPFRLSLENPAGTYKFFVEKQPGSSGSIFTKTVSADTGIKNLAVYPSNIRTDGENRIIYATDLIYDRYFAGVWGK